MRVRGCTSWRDGRTQRRATKVGVGSVAYFQEGGCNLLSLLFVRGGGQLCEGESDVLWVQQRINIFEYHDVGRQAKMEGGDVGSG